MDWSAEPGFPGPKIGTGGTPEWHKIKRTETWSSFSR